MHTKIRKAQDATKRGVDKVADKLVTIDKKVERKLGVGDSKTDKRR